MMYFFDVTGDWESDDIKVVQTTIKAHSAEKAYEKASEKALNGDYDNLFQDKLWYLWEITEDDKR